MSLVKSLVDSWHIIKGFFRLTSKLMFLNANNWGKGLFWVNGHCLSRFWNIGSTQIMYLPGPWIKKEDNEIIIGDFIEPKKRTIVGQYELILDACASKL